MSKKEMTQLCEPWDGLFAKWGYHEEYDEEVIQICAVEQGEESDDDNCYTQDMLEPLLWHFGAYGVLRLLFASEAWKDIPELVQFFEVYEDWVCPL